MISRRIWKERFQNYTKELMKYLRYIFNGHLVFVLLIGMGGLAYYYSEWVATLGPGFPAEWIMSFLLALVITTSPIHTFLREPDMIFLLPLEKELKAYFQKSITASLILNSYVSILILAALMPMYVQVLNGRFGDFLYLFVLIFILTFINMKMRWNILKFQYKSTLYQDWIIRFTVNGVFILFLVTKAPYYLLLVMCIIIGGLWLAYEKMGKVKLLKWERIIELENKRMMRFYQIANMFTDVPKLRNKVSRRRWLDWVLSFIPSKHESTYKYLFARTLLRSNDYAGLWLRLTVIGGLVMAAFPAIWAKLLAVILFQYLTGFQLLTISKHHDTKIWLQLYPLQQKKIMNGISELLTISLVIQGLILALVASISFGIMPALILLGGCIVFVFIFSLYMKRKL
ncbi:ABC transporter permease [Peribacillus alkalitolerans]|uniref:ABC transporter permease n=1 Tax=Peribacillus alkalitolerans TaxID=1550385 RepID=UPI0013D2FA2D|nr:ABC transporter permease [Peribacillus alkalitolerans]